jgi:hypothetical protein
MPIEKEVGLRNEISHAPNMVLEWTAKGDRRAASALYA